MIKDGERIYDGWVSMEAGADAGRDPVTLAPNQCVSAENLTFRGGKPKPRPGFRKLTETITNPQHSYYPTNTYRAGFMGGEDAGSFFISGQDAQTIYRTGIMQSAIGFNPHGNEDSIMAMIGGRLFKVLPGLSTAKVTEITPITNASGPKVVKTGVGTVAAPPLRNRSNIPLAYMAQADKWLIVQDGESKAIIYNGSTARRSNVEGNINNTEIPTGTIMIYGMGRICSVVNDRNIAFGDLFGSHAGPDAGDSVILFTERNFLTEGFDAAIPFQNGAATGMAFFPQLDTSTGTGQLFVFSERGASSFFVSLPRELWKTSAFQIFALLVTGLRGHRSISVVNEDLWFRADDGVRTYRQARSEQAGWAHIPLSTNVEQFITTDTDWLLKYCSSIFFDNRLIMTCSPSWNQGRPTHAGLVVVDFNILSSFGTKYQPAWEGHWTFPAGITVTQLFTAKINGQTRAFAYGIDGDGNNQLYEISLDDKDDFDGQLIQWEKVDRAFDFQKLAPQSNAFSEVKLYDADLWVSEIEE